MSLPSLRRSMAKKKKVKPTAIVRAELTDDEIEVFRNLIPETIVVSPEAFDELLRMLDEPPKEIPGLKKLFDG